jgi:Secretion system C-terminal sorting domain
MKNFKQKYLLPTLLLASFCQVSLAQFKIVPLQNSINKKPSTAKIAAIQLPFFDDFSTSTNTQDLSKWQQGGGVFINNTFTANHPTVNVATFDGLKADGSPYDFNNQLATGATDALTSQTIDLSNPTYPKDSLHLSFFYSKKGLGERPDAKDSLRLQFLTNGDIWKTVWVDSGKVVIDTFARKIIPINAQIYFHNKFQFRFQSYGRQSGQFDVWHIDYVYLDKTRNNFDNGKPDPLRLNVSIRDKDKNVTVIYTRDVACRNPIKSFLKNYNAMPLKQLKADTTKETSNQAEFDFFNLSNVDIPIPVNYSYSVKNLNNGIFLQNDLLKKRESVGSLNSSNAKYANLFIKNLFSQGEKVRLQLKFVTETADNSPFNVNDSISRIVELDNYYAYDDGTAEQAAYLKKGFGRVAIQYVLNKPDGVTAIRIHVPPTITSLAGKRLTLQILNSKNGKPDRILKTISDSTTTIKYANTPNAFIEYKIDSVAVVDTFYVGYVQFTDDEPLVVGLDINSPQFSEKHFYNISNEWVQVPKANALNTNNNFIPIKGSLMIRPVMAGKTVTGKPLATEENIQDKNLVISPNPSTGIFRWNDVSLKNAEVFDMTGRTIFQEKTNNQEVNLQNLNTGVYFLRLSNEKNTFVRKIVKE